MKKTWQILKVILVILLIIVNILLLAGLIWLAVFSYTKMEMITNQLTYLQDTSNIIQSDVSNMESNIEATLEEESSFIEDYTIEVIDTDFASGTYEIAVSAVLKEYTDSTKASIYFGTQEYLLERNGYTYQGSMVLPMDTSYDSNVTFLIMNGDKKNTEVLRNYVGFQTLLKNLLSGEMGKEPTYEDGTLLLDDTISFQLEGEGIYEFETLELVVTVDEEEILKKDLIFEKDVEDDGNADASPIFGSESQAEDSTESVGTVNGSDTGELIAGTSGEYNLDLRYESEVGAEVHIFLRAVSKEQFVFQYDLFGGITAEDGEFLVLADYYKTHYTVTDAKGGKLVLN